MLKTIIRSAGLGLIAVTLSSCGGEDPRKQSQFTGEDATCEALDGRVYLTESLDEGGATPDGVWMMHWRARFGASDIQFLQSDVGIAAEYTCASNAQGELEVSISSNAMSNAQITFSGTAEEPLESFLFNPFAGEPKRYVLSESNAATETCAKVAGQRFEAEAPGGNAMPVEVPFIAFDNDQGASFELTASGQAAQTGIYDCTTGALHIHSRADAAADIAVALVDAHAGRIVAHWGDQSLTLVKVDDGCATELYCTVERQPINCVTTPCPVGVHKTVELSACREELRLPPDYLFAGECGELEGQPYFEQQGCEGGGEVCAAAPAIEVCTTLPCPAYSLKTFRNECQARDADAYPLEQGNCGAEEGKVLETLAIACDQVFAPVCAKVEQNIQCVTTPCDRFGYLTYGNECEADAQLAATAFDGECGDLGGLLTSGEPPVRMLSPLPNTEKEVSIIRADIRDDLLEVELGYSGCGEQHFEMFISTSFRESNPVQADFTFIPQVNDGCLAYFTSTYRYDLRPLKIEFERSYPGAEGAVILPNLVTYRF